MLFTVLKIQVCKEPVFLVHFISLFMCLMLNTCESVAVVVFLSVSINGDYNRCS